MNKFFQFMIILFMLSCEESSSINIYSYNSRDEEVFKQIDEDTTLNVIFKYNATENPNNSIRGFQGCPTIGYHNGVFFSAWMCGVKGEEPGSYICVSSSLNSGMTWSKNEMLIIPKPDTCRQMDPCFWRDRGENLHLSWTFNQKGMWDGGKGGLWHVKIKSEKGKILITRPENLGYGIMNVKPINSFSDSTEMYFPINFWNFNDSIYGGFNYYSTPQNLNAPFIFKNVYDFRNKKFGKPILVSKIPTQFSRTFDEHAILDLGNGYLKCFFRTNLKVIAYSESKDFGKTWSKQQEFKEFGETSDTRFAVGRLKSGNILFILNNSKTRKNMVAYLSTDNGITWPYRLVIDARDNSYPDFIQNDKEEICLIYDRQRANKGEIIFAKFNENDIIMNRVNGINIITVSQLK